MEDLSESFVKDVFLGYSSHTSAKSTPHLQSCKLGMIINMCASYRMICCGTLEKSLTINWPSAFLQENFSNSLPCPDQSRAPRFHSAPVRAQLVYISG